MSVEPDLPATGAGASNVDAENPWPGLASFQESDQRFFHGRDSEVEQLLEVVTRGRIAVFFGLSGLGKTSLLKAGLFPRLRGQEILPVYLRLDFSSAAPSLREQVLPEVLLTAKAEGIEAPEARPGETLWEFFHRRGSEFWSADSRLVTPLLVFDQFEEVFTLGREHREETRYFLEELADLAEGHPPASVRERLEANPEETLRYSFTRQLCKILLCLREDFLADLEDLSERIDSIRYNRFRLQRMNGVSALQAVTGIGGHLIQEDVSLQVVRFVAGPENEHKPLEDLEIEPALLSVVAIGADCSARGRLH